MEDLQYCPKSQQRQSLIWIEDMDRIWIWIQTVQLRGSVRGKVGLTDRVEMASEHGGMEGGAGVAGGVGCAGVPALREQQLQFVHISSAGRLPQVARLLSIHPKCLTFRGAPLAEVHIELRHGGEAATRAWEEGLEVDDHLEMSNTLIVHDTASFSNDVFIKNTLSINQDLVDIVSSDIICESRLFSERKQTFK
jgi:hypothetical protein